MKRLAAAITLLVLLSACAEGKDSAQRTGKFLHKQYVETGQKLREVFTIPPKENPKPQPANDAYCYKAMQDVVCYNVPIEGQDERMKGYQEGGRVSNSVRPMDGGSTSQGTVESNYLVPPSQSISVGSTPPVLTAPAQQSPVAASPSPLGTKPPADMVDIPGQGTKKPVSLMEY